MGDKTIAANFDHLTDETVALEPGSVTYYNAPLDLRKAAHHAVTAYLASVEVYKIPDFRSLTYFAVANKLMFVGFEIQFFPPFWNQRTPQSY